MCLDGPSLVGILGFCKSGIALALNPKPPNLCEVGSWIVYFWGGEGGGLRGGAAWHGFPSESPRAHPDFCPAGPESEPGP